MSWDEAFEREFQCPEGGHAWYFPVKMGDWCICGGKAWGDED